MSMRCQWRMTGRLIVHISRDPEYRGKYQRPEREEDYRNPKPRGLKYETSDRGLALVENLKVLKHFSILRTFLEFISAKKSQIDWSVSAKNSVSGGGLARIRPSEVRFDPFNSCSIMLIPSSAQVSDKTQLCAQGLRLAGLAGGEGAQVPELQLH